MAEDRQLSVRMIAEETGLDKSAVHRILILVFLRSHVSAVINIVTSNNVPV